jgi:hypothetical protein
MMNNAVLNAGVASLMLKFALASWAALWIFSVAEPRKSAAPYLMLLAGICLAASLLGVQDAVTSQSQSWPYACWWMSFSLAVLTFLSQLRRWLHTLPSEVHAEQGSGVVKKKSRKKKSRKKTSTKTEPSNLRDSVETAIASSGAIVAAVALIGSSTDLSRLTDLTWYVGSAHYIVAACLLGITLACCIELTFLSSPDALGPVHGLQVNWKRLSNASLFLAGLEFCACFSIFAFPVNESGEEFQTHVLARLFAFTMLVISYTVWMVPHRIAIFQTTGKPTGWVSLTLAAWLGLLALCVVCSLPGHWPWRNL